MTPNFFPSDREYDPTDALPSHLAGDSSGDHFFNDLSGESPDHWPDHWIEDVLRTVPLPDGFLTRMSLLAQSVQSDASSASSA